MLKKNSTFRYLCKKYAWLDNDDAEAHTLDLIVPVGARDDDAGAARLSSLPSVQQLEAEEEALADPAALKKARKASLATVQKEAKTQDHDRREDLAQIRSEHKQARQEEDE